MKFDHKKIVENLIKTKIQKLGKIEDLKDNLLWIKVNENFTEEDYIGYSEVLRDFCTRHEILAIMTNSSVEDIKSFSKDQLAQIGLVRIEDITLQ